MKTGINGSVTYWGPDEAEERRGIESYLVSIFKEAGFREVSLPTVEAFDILAPGIGEALYPRLYKFLDRYGRFLVLRPDITTPIAYLAATALRHRARPLRLFYIGSIFRAAEPQRGKREEFYQADVEVIGAGPGEADCDTISLAIECLRGLGFTDFRVGIGHADLLEGMMDLLLLGPELRERARAYFAMRNLVGLSELACGISIPEAKRRVFLELPTLHGKGDVLSLARDMIESLPEDGGEGNPSGEGEPSREGEPSQGGYPPKRRILGALGHLADIWNGLSGLGLGEYADFDLGLARRLDYYTGVIFEAYLPGIGEALLGGGRYDKLLERFGQGGPAIGFALDLDNLVEARARRTGRRFIK